MYHSIKHVFVLVYRVLYVYKHGDFIYSKDIEGTKQDDKDAT